jgi:hypothetical protein
MSRGSKANTTGGRNTKTEETTMAQKSKTRRDKAVQKTVAQMFGKTEAEWQAELQKEREEEVQLLETERKQLSDLLDIGAGSPLSHIPKFMHSVSFILDFLLEPETEIQPVVVVGLSWALRECAQRTSDLIIRDAAEKMRASASSEGARP